MARGKGKRGGRVLSGQGRVGGEYSTSVESSSQFSQDMQFPVPSAVVLTRGRKGKNQTAKLYASGKSSTPDDTAAEIDKPTVMPELEAYCRGSWWDIEILRKNHDKYLVHYSTFSDQENEWLPLAHLRVRCRTASISDCCDIHPGVDVCVMQRHPHSEDKSPAWFDAKVIDIERKAHTPKSCKCSFKFALYIIPPSLPLDWRGRTLLPVSQGSVDWKKLSIMREPRSTSFKDIIAASLPDGITDMSPRIWAKDGVRWYSSFDYAGASWDRSPSFESRVAGGGIGPALSRGYHGEHTPISDPELKSFDDFLEEEDMPFENPRTVSSDMSDGDVVIVSSIPGYKAQHMDSGSQALHMDSGSKALHMDSGSKAQHMDSGSKAQPIDLDADVAIYENDDMDDVAICGSDDTGYDFKCLDRYSSDDEYDERATSPERPEDPLETPISTTSSRSLGNAQEDLDVVILSELRPLEPTDQTPFEPISVMSDVSSPLPPAEIVPLVSVPIAPAQPTTSSENSDEDDDYAQLLEQNIVDSNEDDDFAQLLEQNIVDSETVHTVESAGPSEDSDGDGMRDYIQRNNPRHCVAKRSNLEYQGAKHGAKRRRINPQRIGKSSCKPPSLPRPPYKPVAQGDPKKIVKERARVYENQETVSVGASAPVNLDRNDHFENETWKKMIDPEEPHVLDIITRTRDASKTGLPAQPFSHKEKRPKKVGNAAAPKKNMVEITYAELFKSVELEQCTIPLEKDPAEELGLLPSWSPFMESVDPEPQQEDQLANVWEDMRSARESGSKVEKIVEESTNLEGQCENSGEVECQHTVEFDQEIGEVCSVCGVVMMEIGNLWARDNGKRIVTLKEGDNEGDIYGSDYGLGVCFDDDKFLQQNSIEGGSNIELIPHLAKDMQRHQKQGFHFLWRNLAGQDFNGNACFPRIQLGGCVLSHAPGTGKTFLIISFLQSYIKEFLELFKSMSSHSLSPLPVDSDIVAPLQRCIEAAVQDMLPNHYPVFVANTSFQQADDSHFTLQKYPTCRPMIVAPKIMLQPWEKEFRKWNVDIPVYNFNQGKKIFQNHQEAGVVQYGRSKNSVIVHRQAILWEWRNTPSVLVISYPMFSKMTLPSVKGDAAIRIKRALLNFPTIAVLDEGHFARNVLSQAQRQLMAIKTPLRILLSGTLFQNNFEELYTCLNLARSGFVNTFAKIAGLGFNTQQETEPLSDVENERSTAEWKEKAAKAAEAQAKRLFIEEIGNKIDKGQLSTYSLEYAQGLDRLRRLTTSFVHHYTGDILRGLPPLRDFTIVLQPAALQEKMIKTLAERLKGKTLLESEGLLSLVCIHPSLLSQHSVGKTFTDLLPLEEMAQAATDDPAVGVKTRFVMNLLEKLREKDSQEKEKMLIFCLNLFPLTLIESMLKKKFGWTREQEILHIDGKVHADERQSIIERFNDPLGKIRVLLLSTKACGEGVTLTGASRVVFMDVLWNPAVIRQAIHRAFRLGQKRVVHVYRLVVTGSFEEDKYKKMVMKDWKSQTIFNQSDENHEKIKKVDSEVCGPPEHDFWEVEKFSSKDPVLNELERQDAALDQPAFKHVFRHGGLFNDEYKDDPESKGGDAAVWLHNRKDSVYMDDETGGDTPESYDIDGGTLCYDEDTDDSSGEGDNDDF